LVNGTVTSSFKIGKRDRISDEDLFYHLSSCPFFQTYRDGEVGRVEKTLLPLFRYYHLNRLRERKMSFARWTVMLGNYIKHEEGTDDFKQFYKKIERYFVNFYSLFHPSKKYQVLSPFYPYRYNAFMGCAEVVLKTKSGVRIYCYNFGDEGVGPEDLNFYGFKLQCAARIYHLQTGEEPGSMAVVYPASKAVVYYTYNPGEEVEKYIEQNPMMIRRYGTHCGICTRIGCKPLIDRSDRYGWSYGDHQKYT